MNGPHVYGNSGRGGFLTMPAGTFAIDSTSLGGYDRQLSTWLPVSYRAIAPGGAEYAYVASSAEAGPAGRDVFINHVKGFGGFDVQTPGRVRMVAWTSSGIYVASITSISDASSTGLAIIVSETAFGHQITKTGSWPVVGIRYAYGAQGDRIDQLELSTGNVSTLVTLSGARVFAEGIEYSETNLIVAANTSQAFTVTLVPSNQLIFTGPSLDVPAGAADPISALGDDTGIWFTSTAGVIWHYTAGEARLQRAGESGLRSPIIAGPCT